MKFFSLLFFGLSLIFSSCVINGSGYESLSREERTRVLECDVPIDSLQCGDYLYRVAPEQVLDFARRHSRTLVYQYLPFCTGKNCVNPQYVEQFCRDNGFSLCLISSTYDNLPQKGWIDAPRLVIDIFRYKTNNYQKYGRMFYDELTGTTQKQRGYGSFHVFKGGKYVQSYDNINAIVF